MLVPNGRNGGRICRCLFVNPRTVGRTVITFAFGETCRNFRAVPIFAKTDVKVCFLKAVNVNSEIRTKC